MPPQKLKPLSQLSGRPQDVPSPVDRCCVQDFDERNGNDRHQSRNRVPGRRKRNRWLPWAIGLGLVVAVAIGGLFWFFAGDAPAEVDLTETVSAVDESAAVETSDGIEGEWSVDTTVGEFTVTEETTATFAGFRVEEVLESIGSTTAVGRTPGVSGTSRSRAPPSPRPRSLST